MEITIDFRGLTTKCLADDYVRQALFRELKERLAENANVPISILAILIEDENPFVCSRASTTIDNIRRQEMKTSAA